ncbi:S-layer homology domain-containing protein [Solibacillus silvestris]
MANQPKKYKKFVATAATATLVASAIVPVASAASLSDIKGNTHEEAITSLVDAGVINGYPDGTFQPNKTLTRSDVVKLLGKYLVSKGLEVPADYKTNVRFNDLTSASNDELLKYAAVVYDAGVFSGSNGNLLAGDNITRENMAVVLVRAFDTLNNIDLVSYVQGQEYKKDVKDLYTAKSEARSAIEVLDFFDITNPAVANFNPKGSTTRGQFATFLYKTINTDFSAVTGVANSAVSEIKAINNTTVEVTFKETVENIEALDFTIDGLEVKNAVVKQTDAKTVVLTTAAQTGEKVYTLNVNAAKAGTFKGISAVIPTAITVVEKSVQGVLGQQVTVKAQVTVAEGQSKAGIPVTFNVTSDNNTALNQAQVFESVTNAEGVATYTYTRYASTNDSVTAYSTGDRTKFSTGKVYWAAAKQLTVKDITEATTLVNGSKKVYEINQPSNAGGYVFVAFQENLNVTPDKAVRGAIIEGVTTYGINGNATANIITSTANTYPQSLSTGGTTVTAVKLDAAGKANLVVSGSNAAVTPIVYSADYKVDANNNLTYVPAYSATALQAAASTAKFELKHSLGLTIKAEGVQNAATWVNDVQTGGRDYTVTYTDKDGKAAAPGTLVKIAIPRVGGAISVLNSDGDAVASIGSDASNYYYQLPVEAKGEFTFTVVSTSTAAYVSPIVFIDNGKTTGVNVLDTDDLQSQGEVTYFVSTVNYSAALKALDAPNGKPVTSVIYGGTPAYFTYELVDQNGKPRAYNQDTVVSFELRAGTGDINVDGTVIKAGNTGTVRNTITAGNTSTSVKAYAYTPSAITANATGSRSGVVLPSTNPASVTVNFTQYGTSAITGTAVSVDTVLDVLTINNVLYSYADASYRYNNSAITKAAFENYIKSNNATVSVTADADGKLTFNVIGVASATDVVAAVNNAQSAADVQNALKDYPLFKKLTVGDQATVAGTIFTAVQSGPVTAAAINAAIEPNIVISNTVAYTAGTAAVTGAKATGVHTNETTAANKLTIESAAGEVAYNGVKVVFEKATTTGTTVTTSYDSATKTLKVILPVSDAVNGTLDGAATLAAVETAIEANTSTALTVTLAGFAGTESAEELVGKTITLTGATASAAAVNGKLTLTFSEAITGLTDLTLNDVSTTTITPASSAKSLSADGKTLVITLSTAEEAAVKAATTVTAITATPKVSGQEFKVNGYTAADTTTLVPAAPVTISK